MQHPSETRECSGWPDHQAIQASSWVTPISGRGRVFGEEGWAGGARSRCCSNSVASGTTAWRNSDSTALKRVGLENGPRMVLSLQRAQDVSPFRWTGSQIGYEVLGL